LLGEDCQSHFSSKLHNILDLESRIHSSFWFVLSFKTKTCSELTSNRVQMFFKDLGRFRRGHLPHSDSQLKGHCCHILLTFRWRHQALPRLKIYHLEILRCGEYSLFLNSWLHMFYTEETDTGAIQTFLTSLTRNRNVLDGPHF
jgi:hypothetical protein